MSDKRAPSFRNLTLVGLVAAFAAVAALALLLNIFERKQEARTPFFQVAEVTDTTEDPAVWGQNFPKQYERYLRTADQVRTRFGGSEAVPRTPTEADPRSVVAQSKIEEDTRLKTMWAGYAFARDFREERGHAYMLEDQTFTERQAVGQPGTCLNCHASLAVVYRQVGDGDMTLGFERLNAMPYEEARRHADRAIACVDCHEPVTMRLRVTRPAFLEGIRAWKAAVEGIEDYDPNRDATRQEMRSFVCGQCHVEYYFRGEGKRLTYPWTNGMRADDIYEYYQEIGFKDWTHAITGAPVLKAQHPEFEMWNQGVHARGGVACADCHMPYLRSGAQKISDHHVRSPLLSIDNACRTCHPVESEELKQRAERIQVNTARLRDQALDALVDLIEDIGAERENGRSDAGFEAAVEMQRRAQFYIDFVEAENSMGFHAPQEAARVLGEAINYARQGQVALHAPDFSPRIVPRPSEDRYSVAAAGD
ncbi:MAG: ammonia-forming cytochrome c nitrite reductase subunit c552 [Gemmatimonadota bacterium]|nr:ammonia-forming cytochrome c nitrite reductase subunit c552 [Gemmatimonadota bacterium]